MATPLKNFKSKLVIGAECVFQAFWCKVPTIRIVTLVKSNSVAFAHPTKPGSSWLDFPEADEITEPKSGLFIIKHAGENSEVYALVYDFRPESISTVKSHGKNQINS